MSSDNEIPSWMTPALITIVIATVGFAVIVGHREAGQPTASEVSAALSAEEFSRRWNKYEFDNYVYGKTMSDIRSDFGKPEMVSDDGRWTRWSYGQRLPVYDPDAGIQLYVTIVFSSITGEVAEVRY